MSCEVKISTGKGAEQEKTNGRPTIKARQRVFYGCCEVGHIKKHCPLRRGHGSKEQNTDPSEVGKRKLQDKVNGTERAQMDIGTTIEVQQATVGTQS